MSLINYSYTTWEETTDFHFLIDSFDKILLNLSEEFGNVMLWFAFLNYVLTILLPLLLSWYFLHYLWVLNIYVFVKVENLSDKIHIYGGEISLEMLDTSECSWHSKISTLQDYGPILEEEVPFHSFTGSN